MKADRENGFTIIELMIAMVVLALLLAAAAPMFNNLIKNNRMISEVYALRATFNNARSEAMARRTDVTVCRSNDGSTCTAHTPAGSWSEGYIAFSDDDSDGALDPNEVFFSKVVDEDTLTMKLIPAATVAIEFSGQGFARGSAGTLVVCDDRGQTEARGVIIAQVGTVSAATDTDATEDYIANDHMGVNLVCP